MVKIAKFEQLGGPEVIKFVDEAVSDPGAGEVQLEMKAAGLNRAELLFLGGQYLVEPALPSMIGFEGVGRVLKAGPGVEGYSPGDRVAVTPAFPQNQYGVLGEVANIPVHALEPIPDEMDFQEAAAFWMAYGTAYGVVVQSGGLKNDSGQFVLVNGASSSVGIAALQIIKAHGGQSIAVTRGPEKADALRKAGADHIIISDKENLVERVMDITANRGFDIACDAVSGPALETLCDAGAQNARIVQYGLLSGEVPPVPFYQLVAKGISLTGFHLSWQLLDIPQHRKIAVSHLNGGYKNGLYKPLIDRVFDFKELAQGYEHMASNTQLGKILVRIAD